MPESNRPSVASGRRPARPGRGPSLGTRQNESSSGPNPQSGGGSTQSGHADASPVGWARLAVTVAARTVLFSILAMLAWAILPGAIGWTTTTVMTGSMEPRIHPGDVVVSRPAAADAATLGHVLLVDDPDHAGRLRLHRFAEFAPDGNLTLRGDANSTNDSTPVAPSAVHGAAVLRVPYVGLPIVWLAEKQWGNLAAVFVSVSALTLAAASGSSAAPHIGHDPVHTKDTPGRPRASQVCNARPATRRHIRRTARRTRTLKVLLSLAALPVLVTPVLLMAAPSHAAFSATAPTGTSSFTSESSYSCLSHAVLDNPSLLYSFNEVSGAALDTSGNSNTGTLQGAVSRVKGSCSAGDSPALRLAGSPAGYVSASNGAGATPVAAPDTFTVEIWFKAAAGPTAGGRLIGFGNAQTGDSPISDRHLYMSSTGAIAFGAAPDPGNSQKYKATSITSTSGYNDGIWHQATATISAAGMKLYVDGALVNQNTVTSGAGISGYWRVGYDALSTNSWPGVSGSPVFAGTVDNAAVYPIALTPVQVAAHFTATKTEIRGS